MASAVKHREAKSVTLTPSEDKHVDEDIERDIDGVPLRDHKKIDLKQILGHTPEVEDDEDEPTSGSQPQLPVEVISLPGVSEDDDEYEYGYSDDGNDEEQEEDDDYVEEEEKEGSHRRQVQRRSSLKVVSPPVVAAEESPAHKKAVHFADALGLDLAAVRDLINSDEPPEIPQSALKDLRVRKKRSKHSNRFHLTLNFVQPSADPEFMVRLHHQRVVLENCVASERDLAVSGVIRVMNISFEKRVTVRYTTDHWNNFKEVPTRYVPNSNDVATDRFMFILPLPGGFGLTPESGRLEFAIEYHAGSHVHWDSNRGVNYVITCTPVPDAPQTVQPDVESSGSEGEFII